jgi:hypothetical protein
MRTAELWSRCATAFAHLVTPKRGVTDELGALRRGREAESAAARLIPQP